MKLTLSDNIRAMRKERKLTQERLAEALGVTVGAVYKWESGLSVPELGMLVDIADFFDTSVDALLGYRIKDNRLDSMLKRLNQYLRTMDPAAIEEAEKILGKYPHSFKAVHTCALIYLAFGSGNHDTKLIRRSLELLEESMILLPQNDDLNITSTTICGNISLAWFLLSEREKSLEIMKQNNANGFYNSEIGVFLAVYMNRPEEAAPFLSEALMNSLSTMLNTIIGLVFVYRSRGEWKSALDIAVWCVDLLNRVKIQDRPDGLDRTYAEAMAILSYAQAQSGMTEESEVSLRNAAEYAAKFDSRLDYSIKKVRFADQLEETIVFDILGATAYESVEGLLKLLGDQTFSEKWKEINGRE